MGYVRERRILNISFDAGHEFAGLHMRTRSVSTGVLLELMGLYALVGKSKDDITADDLGKIATLFEGFAGALISWDLKLEAEEEGQPAVPVPVPATLDGVKSLDLDFSFALVGEWLNQVGGVSPELGKGSNSGLRFPEGSPMTEASLASLSNSLAPG